MFVPSPPPVKAVVYSPIPPPVTILCGDASLSRTPPGSHWCHGSPRVHQGLPSPVQPPPTRVDEPPVLLRTPT